MYDSKIRSLALLLTVSICFVTSGVAGQERKVRGYVLTKVLTGQTPNSVSPSEIAADASGGRVVVQIRHRGDCVEKTTFEWTFDRDVRFLRYEDVFSQKTSVSVNGDCDRNPFAFPHGHIPILRDRLGEEEKRARRITLIADPPRNEGQQRIYGKKAFRWGTASDTFAAESEGLARSPYTFLAINLNATSPRELYIGEILYLFRAVYSDDQPGEETIEIDNPQPGEDTTVSIPPNESTPDPPPSPPGDVSCLDPAVQKCIQEWLDKAVALRNQNQPELGPWSISRYGHWLNKLAVSFQAPDEWETKYHSSKYCFVAMNFGKEHQENVYRGQLPALADYIAKCSGQPTAETGNDNDRDGIPDDVDPDDDNDGIPDSRDNTPTGTTTTPPSGVQDRTLWAPQRVVREGQRVLVPIWLLKPDGVANIDFSVTYDPSVVVPEGKLVKGSLLGAARLEENSQTLGIIKVAFAQTASLRTDGIVANLPFRVVGNAGQRTPLSLGVSDIDDVNGNSLPIKLVDGEIIIQSPGQGTRGDCDGDGQLSVADAICALKMAVDLMPLDMNMDIDGDGQVTSGDAREILQGIP